MRKKAPLRTPPNSCASRDAPLSFTERSYRRISRIIWTGTSYIPLAGSSDKSLVRWLERNCRGTATRPCEACWRKTERTSTAVQQCWPNWDTWVSMYNDRWWVLFRLSQDVLGPSQQWERERKSPVEDLDQNHVKWVVLEEFRKVKTSRETERDYHMRCWRTSEGG